MMHDSMHDDGVMVVIFHVCLYLLIVFISSGGFSWLAMRIRQLRQLKTISMKDCQFPVDV
jgi:hypothetical protein